MEQGRLAFTAVYLKIQPRLHRLHRGAARRELARPHLDEARDTLQKLAAVVFDEERRGAEEMIAGKDVVRENFVVPIPRARRSSVQKAAGALFISAAAPSSTSVLQRPRPIAPGSAASARCPTRPGRPGGSSAARRAGAAASPA